MSTTDAMHLWVYPRSCPLAPLRSCFAKDVEGPTTDTSPAGDVAFHTLREYNPGDDVRHVHPAATQAAMWPSPRCSRIISALRHNTSTGSSPGGMAASPA